MNQALRSENANASGGTSHPPFHFDYVEVDGGSKNAHAFEHAGFSFIVVTRPLVEMLWDLSRRLSQSALVLQLLGIDREVVRLEAFQALLFQWELAFVVSHEYTHHIHRHSGSSSDRLWSEFTGSRPPGELEHQAQELDADGYALYLTLANYVRGAARQNALAQVGMQNCTGLQGDEFLITGFFVALTALFCSLWPENVPLESVSQRPHPPAPVRIEHAIRIAAMWSNQNTSVPESWFSSERFQAIYLAATSAVSGGGRPQWDSLVAFLRGEVGAAYYRELSDRFEVVRKAGEETVRVKPTHSQPA